MSSLIYSLRDFLRDPIPFEAITVENIHHLPCSFIAYPDLCSVGTQGSANLPLHTNFDIFIHGFRLYTVMLTKSSIPDAADAERYVYLIP